MVGKDKERMILTISKEDKTKLQEIAKEENRSLNNLINTILKEYLKKSGKQAATQGSSPFMKGNKKLTYSFSKRYLCISLMRFSNSSFVGGGSRLLNLK